MHFDSADGTRKITDRISAVPAFGKIRVQKAFGGGHKKIAMAERRFK